jgi:hypothetical protein
MSFTNAAGPRQRSHSQVRVPRDSWPHFTVSDSRLLQPAGPGPRIYIPQRQSCPRKPRHWVLFSSPLDYDGGIRTRLHTESHWKLQLAILYNLCTDLFENKASDIFCIVAFVYSLQRTHVHRPFPTNGGLFGLHDSGFEPSYHNISNSTKIRFKFLIVR